MCDIWKTDSVQEISAEELERHAGDLERLQVEWVVSSGGEPLMHSDLFRLSGILRRRNIRTTVLSTGLLFERNAQGIAESIDDAIVSLDGPPEIHDRIRRVPGAFENLERGVRAIHRMRADFPIGGRCTVQRENHVRLRETVECAKDLGLQSISFLAVDMTSPAFNRADPAQTEGSCSLDLEQIGALEAEMEALIAAGDPFVLETPDKLRRIVRHFKAHRGLVEPQAPRCNAPWVSAVIESDGTVRPCFFHAPIGNLRGRSLSEVLNSPVALEFRTHLNIPENPICRRCVCSLMKAPATTSVY